MSNLSKYGVFFHVKDVKFKLHKKKIFLTETLETFLITTVSQRGRYIILKFKDGSKASTLVLWRPIK